MKRIIGCPYMFAEHYDIVVSPNPKRIGRARALRFQDLACQYSSDTIECCLVDPFKETVTPIEIKTCPVQVWKSRNIVTKFKQVIPTNKTIARALMFAETNLMSVKTDFLPDIHAIDKRKTPEILVAAMLWDGHDLGRFDADNCSSMRWLPGFTVNDNGVITRGRALVFKNFSFEDDGYHFRTSRSLKPEDIEVTWVKPDKSDDPVACVGCGKTIKTKKCQRCLLARYCSAECQKKDWKNHKVACTLI